MIDRDRVAQIIGQDNSCIGGHQLLDHLEAEGYRVVRAGMVPKFDDLDSISMMLEVLAQRVDGHSAEANQADLTLRTLRDLALLVLRIDRDDVDQTGG